MRNFRWLVLLIAVLVGVSTRAQAQTSINDTTLSAAVAVNDNTVSVTSASTIVAGHLLYVDMEAMDVVSVSGTVITVRRGVEGTLATAHANARIVFSGARQRFYSTNPEAGGFGTCTRTALQYLPWINIREGIIWQCDYASAWRGVRPLRLAGTNSTITATSW